MTRKLLTVLLLTALLIPMIGGLIPVTAKNAKTDYNFNGIYLTRSSVDLKVGGSCYLTVRRIKVPKTDKLTWHSWDTSIATVSESGEVTAVGTHEELLKTSDIYREVYESQMKGGEDE